MLPFTSEIVKYHPLGLEVLNRKPGWDAWLELFQLVVTLNTSSGFALADAYILGEENFGEDAAQAVVLNQIPRRRLQRSLRVGRFWVRAPRKRNRRRPVSFWHHHAVTGLAMDSDAGFAFACELLDAAAKDPEMTAAELEDRARKFDPDEDGAAGEGPEVEFSVGSLEQRLIRYHRTGVNLKDDLPEDWTEEHGLLSSALGEVDACLNSVRNRAIGEPAA